MLAGCRGNSGDLNRSDTATDSEALAPNHIRVTWHVTLPFALPSERVLTMGTDLNNWAPSNTNYVRVKQVDDTHYTVTKDFEKNPTATSFTMAYKWVLYTEGETNEWFGVELRGQNRSVTINYASENVFNDTINSFENIMDMKPSSKQLGSGTLHINYVNNRRIRIYTPSTYDSTNPNKKFPVLYMHDGQNLFEASTSFAGEWEVDESLESIIAEKGWEGALVVGIDNTSKRMSEYLYPTGYINIENETPSGDAYMNLIVNDIKPFIDQNFHTLSDREHTLIGGSSLGGLISLFGGLHHLQTFGTILAFSTSTWTVSDEVTNIPALLASRESSLLQATKFFFYVGTSGDGSDTTWPDRYRDYLLAVGVPEVNAQTYYGVNYGHNEGAWAKHFPIGLKWALGYGFD